MAYLDDLTSRRTSLMTALDKAIAAGPNHTITDQNGSRTIDSGDYIKQLTEQIQAINELIARAQPFWRNERVYI